MNDLSRRLLHNTNTTTKDDFSAGMASIPAIRRKDRALEALENIYRPVDKLAAAERQRLAAERLSKGYSVVRSKSNLDKENVKDPFQKQVTGKENIVKEVGKAALSQGNGVADKENTRTTFGTLRTSSIGMPKWNKFQAPGKPSKSKKTSSQPLKKSESVVSLLPCLEEKCDKETDEADSIDVVLSNLVIDGDKKFENDELLLGIYARDIYKYLRRLENEQSVRKGYLTKAHLVSESMRAVLVDWLYEVKQSFDLLLDTVQMAIALLDRFLQDAYDISRDTLQLVGVTCLFIAAKYEEMYPPVVTELVQVSANAFTKQHILKMEQTVIKSLRYNIGKPAPLQFLRRFCRTGQVDNFAYTLSKYFVDLALVQYSFSHYPPSLLSAVALYLALSLMDSGSEDFWTPTLQFYTEYPAKTLTPIVPLLAKVVLQAPRHKQQCVQTMYSSSKWLSVSKRAESMAEKLKTLVEDS